MLSSLRDRLKDAAEKDDDFDESLFDRKPFLQRWGLRLAIWPVVLILCGWIYVERQTWLQANETADAWKAEVVDQNRLTISELAADTLGKPELRIDSIAAYPLVRRQIESVANVYVYTWDGLLVGFDVYVYAEKRSEHNGSVRVLAVEGPNL